MKNKKVLLLLGLVVPIAGFLILFGLMILSGITGPLGSILILYVIFSLLLTLGFYMNLGNGQGDDFKNCNCSKR